jgi:predicted transcriptional regulator
MERDISYVKHTRAKLDLTQKELSKLSGVSQSMIAKIEAGLVDPTYNVAKKLFSALDNINNRFEHKASEFLNKKVLFCYEDDTVKSIISLMKKHAISQMPVIDNKEKLVGEISENVILFNMDKITKEGLLVKDIMQDAPPVVSKNTSHKALSHLLSEFPFVLVSEKGKYLGIITKSDLISGMYR